MQGVPLQTFMQALQPTQLVFAGNPFMAPQYPAVAPMMPQAPPLAQLLPLGPDHPFVQPLAAAISENLLKDINRKNAPADMSPENEEILINVLKKGEEQQWSMERIFEELSQKHGHTRDVWVGWFAMNLRKLYPNLTLNPEANAQQAAGGNEAGKSNGSSSQGTSSIRSVVSNNRPASTSVQEQSQSRPRRVVIVSPKSPAGSTQANLAVSAPARAAPSSNNDPPTNSTRTAPTNGPSPSHSQSTFSAPTPYSANRSKRGASVLPIVHDQTAIPWTDGSTKPSPPTRSESSTKLPLPRRTSAGPAAGASSDSGNGGRLTDDEKIFFVHWLRWRLREGPLPEKETLFEELEDELPHRAAETWKQHWGGHCEVPDGIYIEARKRVERERAQRAFKRTVAPATAVAAAVPGEHSDGSDSDDYDSGDDSPARKPSKPTAAAPQSTKNSKPGPMSRPPGRLPITDEDLRAMARYRFAKRADWSNPDVPHKPFWREFAERPENGKRSWDGWNSVARNPKHLAAMDQYVKELEDNQISSAALRRSKPRPPQQTRPVASPSSSRPARQPGDSTGVVLKRAAALGAADQPSDSTSMLAKNSSTIVAAGAANQPSDSASVGLKSVVVSARANQPSNGNGTGAVLQRAPASGAVNQANDADTTGAVLKRAPNSGAARQPSNSKAALKRPPAAAAETAAGDDAGAMSSDVLQAPAPKRRKTGWDVDQADVVDLTADSEKEE